MKKLFLLLILLISLKVSAQTTYWAPGVPPGSTSFTPTFRFTGTDSLANYYINNSNRWSLFYTAAQSNLTYLRLHTHQMQTLNTNFTSTSSTADTFAYLFSPNVNQHGNNHKAWAVKVVNTGTASACTNCAVGDLLLGPNGSEDQGDFSIDGAAKLNKIRINFGTGTTFPHSFTFQDSSSAAIGRWYGKTGDFIIGDTVDNGYKFDVHGNAITRSAQTAQNFYTSGTGGTGYLDMAAQSVSPASTASRLKIYPDSLNRLSWKNSSYRRTIWVNRAADMTIKMPYRLNPVVADSTDVAGTYISKTPLYGKIFDKSTFSSIAGFTNNGAQYSFSGGQMVLADSTNSNGYLNSMDITGGTLLDKWIMTVNFIVPATLSATTSFAIGTRSTNTYGNFIDVIGDIDLTNTASAGTLTIKGAAGGTILATSASKLTFAAGDKLEIYITRDGASKTIRVSDITTPTTDVSVSFSALGVVNTAAQDIVNIQNTGRFSLFAKASTAVNITSVKVSSPVITGPDIIMVGDSESGGVVDSYAALFSSLLSQNYSVMNAWGSSEGTADKLLQEPEVLALKPKAIIYMCGVADIASSVPLATIEANITTFINNAAAVGIPVYQMTGIWSTDYDVSALATWIRATYPNNYIETFLPTQYNLSAWNYTTHHPSNIAHTIMYNAVINSGFFPGGRSKSVFTQNDFNNAFGGLFSFTPGTTFTMPSISGTLISGVTSANGVSATNTSGLLSIALGAITPTSVSSPTITASTTLSYGTTNFSAAAWGTSGIASHSGSNKTYTDNTTADGATVTNTTINSFLSNNITYANSLVTGITPTSVSTVFIQGAPTVVAPGGGVLIAPTNSYALNVNGGAARFGGLTASKPLFTAADKSLTVTGPGTSSQIMFADGSFVTSSGDVTNSAGVFTIGANKVTLAKMATQANNTILGNVSGSTAVPTALTATQVNTMLARGHTLFTPTTGATITAINNQINIVNPAGTIATLTITFPASPANNDVVEFKFTQIVTALTYSGNGASVGDSIGSAAVGGYIKYTYDSGANTWY